MIVSRAFRLANVLNKSSNGFQSSLHNVSTRNSHTTRMAYRSFLSATERQHRVAEMLGAFFWGWIFYHCINDYDLLLGEFYSPKPALWTDEELGIPPDEEGPYTPKQTLHKTSKK